MRNPGDPAKLRRKSSFETFEERCFMTAPPVGDEAELYAWASQAVDNRLGEAERFTPLILTLNKDAGDDTSVYDNANDSVIQANVDTVVNLLAKGDAARRAASATASAARS